MGASGTLRVLSSEMTPAAAAVAAVMAALLLWVSWSATWLWWAPRRLERSLRVQGLLGTRYCFPSGDLKEHARLIREALIKPLPLSHCIIPRVSPFLHRVINQCGKFCITWNGPIPGVTIMNPDLIREILSTKFGHFEKAKINPLGKLLVAGLVSYEGEKWARHRRIINPAFHIEKLRRMQPAFSSCCSELIERWEKLIDHDGTCELDVWPEFQNLTSDVISKTAFGNSHEEGRRVFQLQTEQAQLLILSFQNVYIPGFRDMVVEGLRTVGYDAYKKVCRLGLWEGDFVDSLEIALAEALETCTYLNKLADMHRR